MFLKTLNLKGFKSFADPTTLEFEPGVTVVVGPNGSGKSNIVDAVAWVLGAQGPRTVRSSKMEDVIFAGSPRRPPLGRAEVSLTIDNTAGLLPIDFSEVTITRNLFRSGDSEYAINGAPCRLLDVEELLSDTGVGRQQHVIVSQGQLDAVLNSRPEDRRLIIEEAAGVLKYRRRREKALRRLESTEASLLRLQDLLREVRRQLRPLERQAEAARRHEVLAAELGDVRRFLAGRDLAAVEARLASSARSAVELARSEDAQRAALADLDARVLAAEAELSAVHDRAEAADLADLLSRAEALRARARGLAAVLVERARSIERARAAAVDTDVVASLESEAARLAAELADVDRGCAGLAPEATELDRAEATLADEAAELDRRDDLPAPGEGAQRAAEVRGELSASRSAVERDQAELRHLDAGLEGLERRLARLDDEAAQLRARTNRLAEEEGPLGVVVDTAVTRRRQAEASMEAAEERWRAAQADEHRWAARVEALSAALDEARARAGTERLGGVEGILGALPELVEVDEGWEAAFEAAAGEALAATMVRDVGAARRALAHLHRLGARGAVVAPRGGMEAGTAVPPSQVPPGAEPLRGHVRASPASGAGRLLDELLRSAVVVHGGWEQALELSLAHPGLVVVTLEGDRFAAAAWRAGAAGPSATATALEEAVARADAAAAGSAEQAAAVERCRAERLAAAASEGEAGRSLDAAHHAVGAATAALHRAEEDRREASAEHEAQLARRLEVANRLRREEERLAELGRRLPALEAAEAARAERARG